MNYPFEFVDEKLETVGLHQNKMDLYAYSGKIDVDLLSQFCQEQKKKFIGYFYHIVLFDDKNNAKFPSKDPFTSEYSDEETVKYIRAIYIHNTVNGYSKLKIYETNKSQYPAQEIDV